MSAEPYCEIGDLPKAYCAHCLGHKLPAEVESDDPADERASSWFQAEWSGKCVCGDDFRRGTVVRYENGGLRTQDCEADQ